MNESTVRETRLEAVTHACSRIAPAWPLDRLIAVNPWWERIDSTLPECAARVSALSGARFLMPRPWYQQKWESGRIGLADLRAACQEAGLPFDEEKLFAHLAEPKPAHRIALMTHAMDAWRDLSHNVAWEDEVVHEVSQFCAAYFDRGQATWHVDTSRPLYLSWKRTVVHERGIGLLMGVKGLRHLFRGLPEDRDQLIDEALAALGVPDPLLPDYLEALLLSLNGWASWCAWRRWQDRLDGANVIDSSIQDLLAIRLAWEWVLYQHARQEGIPVNWSGTVESWKPLQERQLLTRRLDWIWHRAFELAHQEALVGALSGPPAPRRPAAGTEVKAYFCIDVRSEVFRRALERQDERIETGGFAGFFGLPIAYQAAGMDVMRPQLPGLLGHSHVARETCASGEDACEEIGKRRRAEVTRNGILHRFRTAATAIFSYVEAAGLLYGVKLMKDGFFPGPAKRGIAGKGETKPCLHSASEEAYVREGCALAARILQAMFLTDNFPPLVLLAGHGSRSENNPHAAGLDCGACCGQTGEVNARVLARLLNDSRIRDVLQAGEGIQIPDTTRFVPALHNTTTDEVELFDAEEVPREAMERLRGWLRSAGEVARAERASRLGYRGPAGEGLLARFTRRSHDWSQVRPEWGLANNSCFIVAPRSRTRHLDLQGRSFLHDYEWKKDPSFAVLELIMTAPMVVTHWINMQYYASTVDNRRYGSGNKVLHNVVGGTIGVFEGNGGDLRIGLPLQSLHDGTDWVHEPVRLSVFIAAPREAIDAIIQKHPTVKNLVENGWIDLFQLDDGEYPVYRRTSGGWRTTSR